LTFYWTNDQGARLMFYHDHAYGLTRLNVYAGEAAGYLLYDTAEEDALAAGTTPGTIGSAASDLGHLIPLVIQDKTFVPSKLQLDAQDPTWDGNFGATPLNTTTASGNGDLWFPHVYMPNQNPNDPMGSNAFGRWDYGAWFFPPQTSLTAAAAAGSTNGITLSCTSKSFPAQTLASSNACPSCGCPITPNPSGTPEGFMDTPVVNGVAYPVLHVAPAAYRFKILSAGNDRSWNLSWFLADATQANTEVAMLPAAPPSNGSAVPLCTAINPVAVPSLVLGLVTGLLDNSGNPLNGTGLQAGCWPNYGPQPGIPTSQSMWAADGRAGGAPDPRNAGPAWIEIGSEGGLLPAPVVIPPTPINYEQNTRSITITSVAMHGLWLGPAERADVIVDFSQFAGKTLILYNDAPTPAPAIDSRLDYFTNDGDQSPIGGAPNTPPGYGPNTRTIMQVVVDATNPNTVPFSLSVLKGAFASTATTQGVFAKTQPTTIVPEPVYNSAYAKTFPTTYSGIQNTTLTFKPLSLLTLDSSCTAIAPAQCDNMRAKTIQELFTLDYGRMNATLGTELPNVNFANQTTIPLAYIDPPTEIIRQGDTQLWKITHNGVDSHFIHFHLFNVQVINRVGWDGSIRPIDANEAGWKDTVRMNPLEDVIVALQPITPATPFPVANSVRLLDVTTTAGTTTASGGTFSDLNPFTNGGVTTQNELQNFGWEYVWHCHILGHEENDMMRPIIFQVPPPTPSNLVAVAGTGGVVNLSFTDNSANETGFVIQRSTDPNFVNPAPVSIAIGSSTQKNGAGEGIDWGGIIPATDSNLPTGTNYYRVQAVDDGWLTSGAAKPMAQTYSEPVLGSSATCLQPTAPGTPVAVGNCPLVSGWSNTASVGIAPFGSIAPMTLAFGNVTVGTTATNLASGQLAQVTISNSGNSTLTLSSLQTGSTDFSSAGGCTSVNAGSTCLFTVTYTPTMVGPASATITFTTNDPVHPTLAVSMTGAGIVGTAISINAPSITYNANGVVTLTIGSTPSGFIPAGNVTLAVDGGTQISQVLNTSGVATFTIASLNAGTHALFAAYATQGGFQASSATGSLIVAQAPLVITASSGSFTYGGTVPVITASFSGFVGTDTSAVLTKQPTCSTTAISLSGVSGNPYPSNCTGAAALNYAISYVAGTVKVLQAKSATAITSNKPNPSIIGQIVTITFGVAPQLSGIPTGSVTVRASTGETCTGTLAAGAGSCTITFAIGGARTLTAAYSGDSNFVSSASTAAVTQNVSGVSLSTTSLLFGNQAVGTRSAAQTVTLANVGTTTLTINSITWSTNFSDTSNCGTSLSPGQNCRINIVFAPTTTGVLTGTLTIRDSDVTSPQVVTLTGTGVQAKVSLTPTSANFGTVPRRTTSAPQTFTLTNTGTAALTINSIGLTGASPGQFIISSRTCGTTLPVGANCTINVSFAPNRAGTFTANLSIADNAPNSPQTATLSGTGQ
jgi:FtsP/CotA-like multicopper oxidase with cupredoxin domain